MTSAASDRTRPGDDSARWNAKFFARRDRVYRKARGQFFTPAPIADLMADWALGAGARSVIDPAVGTGALLAACRRRAPDIAIAGCDIDESVLDIASERLRVPLHHRDFLTACSRETFEAAVCNPPFIRHHGFELSDPVRTQIALAARQKISRLSNIYVYFILKLCQQLRPGGRASILVPAEWTNANYGNALKHFFRETGCLKQVIYFSADGLPFDDNLSTACLLNIEATRHDEPVETIYVPTHDGATTIEALRRSPGVIVGRKPMSILAGSKKWNDLIAGGTSDRPPGYVAMRELVTSKRGIATGDNGFFLLSDRQRRALALPASDVTLCVSKSAQAPEEIFSVEHARALKAGNAPVLLFDPALPLADGSANYIAAGITNGTDQRYLTRTKSLWFRAEKRDPADIWAGVFGRGRIRFIHNEARVKNLTCFHGLYLKEPSTLRARALTACLNSAPVIELAARQHRVYGGGLLKVEPKDLLDMEVPDINLLDEGGLIELARLVGGDDAVERAAVIERVFASRSIRTDRLL